MVSVPNSKVRGVQVGDPEEAATAAVLGTLKFESFWRAELCAGCPGKARVKARARIGRREARRTWKGGGFYDA